MKKLIRYVVMTFMALMMTVPCWSSAEAGNILLLPVINKAENTNPEVISQIYYREAMDAMRDLPEYQMINSDELDDLKKVPTKEEMISLAKAKRADMVVCMQLDTLDYTIEKRDGDRFAKLDLQGFCISYDAATGKYVKHRIMEDTITEEEVTNRWDWTGEEWGKSVRREMDRLMKNKKIKLYAPRIGSLR